MGSRQAADHRGGDRPAQGLLLSGAPPRQDVGRAAGTPGGQGRGLHLWTANQRLPRPPAATFGGSARLTNCTSVVLDRSRFLGIDFSTLAMTCEEKSGEEVKSFCLRD